MHGKNRQQLASSPIAWGGVGAGYRLETGHDKVSGKRLLSGGTMLETMAQFSVQNCGPAFIDQFEPARSYSKTERSGEGTVGLI